MSILPDPDADALGDIRDTTGRPLAAALPCPPCLDAIARGVAPVHLPPAQHTGGPVRILTWGQTPDGRPILRVQDIPGDDGEPLTPLREAIGPPRPPSPPDRPRRGP